MHYVTRSSLMCEKSAEKVTMTVTMASMLIAVLIWNPFSLEVPLFRLIDGIYYHSASDNTHTYHIYLELHYYLVSSVPTIFNIDRSPMENQSSLSVDFIFRRKL